MTNQSATHAFAISLRLLEPQHLLAVQLLDGLEEKHRTAVLTWLSQQKIDDIVKLLAEKGDNQAIESDDSDRAFIAQRIAAELPAFLKRFPAAVTDPPVGSTEHSEHSNADALNTGEPVDVHGPGSIPVVSVPKFLKGRLATEAGVPVPDLKLCAFIVTLDDTVGLSLGEAEFAPNGVDWAIQLPESGASPKASAPLEPPRPHLRFEIRRRDRDGQKPCELLRLQVDLSQRLILEVPNHYYSEFERVQAARVRLPNALGEAGVPIKADIAAAEGRFPADAFNAFDSARRDAETAGLPDIAQLMYGLARVRSLPGPGELLKDDLAALDSAVKQGLVGEEVLDPRHRGLLDKWHGFKADAEARDREEAKRHLEEAEREQKKNEAEAAERKGQDQARQLERQWLGLEGAESSSSIGAILKHAGVPEQVQLKYARILIDKPGSKDEEIEEKLAEDAVAQRHRKTLSRVRELVALIGLHPPLLNHVWSSQLVKPSKLEVMTAADWKAMLDNNDIDPPAELALGTAKDPRDRYAAWLEDRLEARFPRAVLLSRLERKTKLRGVRALLQRHTDLDLRSGTIPQVPAQPPGAQESQDVDDLHRLQRLLRVGSASDAVGLFTETNLRSASDVAAMSADAFARLAKGAGIHDWRAQDIHRAAVDRAAKALVIAAGVAPGLLAGSPGAVSLPAGSEGSTANLANLFGPEGACVVRPCESMLGLPAYLFDLLEALRQAADDDALLKTLFERRPDIGEIELSCANSETRLPQVDLVNEILERAVVEGGSSRPFPQTTWTAQELAAGPEHFDPVAYDRLRDADHPWSLPFSLAHAEARAWLGLLGTSLVELIEMLNPPPEGDLPNPAIEARLAGECLQMTLREVTYFASPQPGMGGAPVGAVLRPPEARFWGYPNDGNRAWRGDQVSSVRVFLARAGVTWKELLDLLVVDHVNPGHDGDPFAVPSALSAASPVRINLGADPCNLDSAKLVGLSAGFLARFRLFVRLWRRLGWTVRELDRAIEVFGGDLSRTCFQKIAALQRLREELQLPVADLLVLYRDIDAASRWDKAESPLPRQASQFERIFLHSDAVATSHRAAFEAILGGSASSGMSLNQMAAPVRAVLGLSATDLQVLTNAQAYESAAGAAPPASADTDHSNVLVANDKFDLGSLSRLFRAATLSRALGVSVAELLVLREVFGIDPFESPSETRRFSVVLQQQRRAWFSVAELDYLLRHRGPIEAARSAARAAERAALQGRLVKETDGAAPPDALATAVSLIATHFKLSVPVATVMLKKLGVHGDAASTSLSDRFNNPDVYTRAEKAAFVITRLRLDGFELGLLREPGDDDLRPCAAFAWTTLPAAAAEARPLGNRHADFRPWQHLVDLVEAHHRLEARKASLWQLRLVARAPAPPPSATGGADPLTVSWQKVSSRLGVHESDLMALVADRPDELTGTAWLRIAKALELADKLGVTVGTAKSWVVSGDPAGASAGDWLTQEESQQIRQAARARHDAQSWAKVAQPMRDALREQQRDALVAYLCARDPTRRDATALSGKFLVDVCMGAQQYTSRVALAVASVQMFVQRILLGQEAAANDSTLSLDEAFAQRWEWMKRHDSWARRRSVFLFPENYLRPELRADKSPLFVEAEQALVQRELKPENLEDTVAEYVEKLEALARLEVVGTCLEDTHAGPAERAERARLHIVARTNGQPAIYHHRVFDQTSQFYTPWQKIELVIDGEWVLPIMRDGVLTLYWVKQEKNFESMKEAAGMTSAQPFPMHPHLPTFRDYYRLSWSSCYRGKWTPKKSSDKLISRPYLPFTATKFAVRVVGDRVRISGLTVLQPDFSKAVDG